MRAQRYKHHIEGFRIEGPDMFIWSVAAVLRRVRSHAPNRYEEVVTHLPQAVFDPDKLQREEAGRAIARSDGYFGTLGFNLRTFTRIFMHETGHKYHFRHTKNRSEEAADTYAYQLCRELSVEWEPYQRAHGEAEAEAEYVQHPGPVHHAEDPPIEWCIDADERLVPLEDWTGFRIRRFSGRTMNSAAPAAVLRTKGSPNMPQQNQVRQGLGGGMVPMTGGSMASYAQSALGGLSKQDEQHIRQQVARQVAGAMSVGVINDMVWDIREEIYGRAALSQVQWSQLCNSVLQVSAQMGDEVYGHVLAGLQALDQDYMLGRRQILRAADDRLAHYLQHDPLTNQKVPSLWERLLGL